MEAAARRGEITRLLRAHRGGDSEAFDRLVPLVYEHLKRLARQQLRHGRPGRTLDTVALAHEAYFRLVDERGVDWQNRAHFYGVTSRAMRRIIVDYARRRGAKKRGGDRVAVELDPDR
ncbi:MAG: ECF-type sigma factor, partial [Holophagales bacterium]|nr:ECF-type sigma factor [Holophagales bacterium]